MKTAICLLRVSSDRQLQEGRGIDVQKRTCDFYADRNGFSIVRYFTEHFSGRKADRHVLDEIIQFASDNQGEIDALIVSQIDRFTRAGADVYLYLQKRLRALGVQLLDASGVIQQPVNTLAHTGFEYEWSVRSPSRLTETILAEQANAEATQILTRCIGGQIETAQAGFQFKSAEFGFRNDKTVTPDGRKRTIMVREDREARWIEAMFRLRAEGQLSNEAICDRVNAMGYRSRVFRRYDPVTREIVGEGGGVPLTVKQMHLHIRRPVYCGVRAGKWMKDRPIWLPDDTPRLVSIETFNRANRGDIRVSVVHGEILIEKNLKTLERTRDTDDFIFRHVIVCPHCGSPFKASRSRGKSGRRFGYYHCSRGHDYLGVNAQEFEQTLAKTIRSITFKKKLIGVLKEIVRDVWVTHHKADELAREQITAHVDTLKNRKRHLLERIERSRSEAVQQALEAEFEETDALVREALSQLTGLERADDNIEAYFAALKRVVEHPEDWLLKPQPKASLVKAWGFVFEEPPTWRQMESRTPRLSLPFRFLASSEAERGRLVELLRLESNTLVAHIRGWMNP